MQELKEVACWNEPEKPGFPIHDKLEKLLSGFFAYTTRESSYPAVYDAVFILLRSLYTPRELASLFTPMLCRNKDRQRMYEEPQT